MTFKRWFNKDKKEKLELGLGEVLLEELYNEKCEIEKKYVSGISEITRQKNYVNFYKVANNNRARKIQELKKENNKLLDVINNQDVKIADLEQQIEKMKCCQNCKHCAKIPDYDLDNEEDNNIEFCEIRCHERSGWELKEIEK